MSSMNEGMSPVIYQRLTSNEDWINLGLWHGLHFKCTEDGAKQESSRPICDEKIQHEIPLRRHGIVSKSSALRRQWKDSAPSVVGAVEDIRFATVA